ncbi:MAG TPA: hypothetical protein VGB92_14090 [Longimicrobium sp.]|jgi:hypothetical protein
MRTLHRITLASMILAACGGPNQPTPRGPYLAECASTAGPAGTDSAIATATGPVTVVVRGGGGQHVLQVPAGAAQPGTVFILTALPAPQVGVEAHVRGQDTYTFLNGQRATLRINAQHCTTEEYGKLRAPTILRVERDGSFTVLPSQPAPTGGRSLSAELPSLSRYAIGSN